MKTSTKILIGSITTALFVPGGFVVLAIYAIIKGRK